ncbi:MAG: acyl carrier protein [Pseudomonadales bacterium]
MPDKSAIFDRVASVLAELFELDREAIQLSSHLADDLDIDSIDAADLIVEMKKYTGKPIDPEDFKQVRRVGDIVDIVSEMLGDE